MALIEFSTHDADWHLVTHCAALQIYENSRSVTLIKRKREKNERLANKYFPGFGPQKRNTAAGVITILLLVRIRISDRELTGIVDAIRWRLKKVELWKTGMALIEVSRPMVPTWTGFSYRAPDLRHNQTSHSDQKDERPKWRVRQ